MRDRCSFGTAHAALTVMHVYLTARHFDLTDSIRQHVEQHIVQAIEQHADAHALNRVEVQLSLGAGDARYACHVLLQLPQHREINVTEESQDLYGAISQVQKRLIAALTSQRDKSHTFERHAKHA